MVPPGALLTAVCSCVGWSSRGDLGVGAARPVVGVHGFGCRHVDLFGWLSVVLREDAGTDVGVTSV